MGSSLWEEVNSEKMGGYKRLGGWVVGKRGWVGGWWGIGGVGGFYRIDFPALVESRR